MNVRLRFTPHPNPLPQGERERTEFPPLPLRERVGVRGLLRHRRYSAELG